MSTFALKQKLVQQIELIDNEEVLEEVYRMLELGSYTQEETALHPQLKDAIDKGLGEYRLGKIVTNEQAQKDFNQGLNK
jgi:hypothetical protein